MSLQNPAKKRKKRSAGEAVKNSVSVNTVLANKVMKLQGYKTDDGRYPHVKPEISLIQIKEVLPDGAVDGLNPKFSLVSSVDELIRCVVVVLLVMFKMCVPSCAATASHRQLHNRHHFSAKWQVVLYVMICSCQVRSD
jgi:hypothetical protein